MRVAGIWLVKKISFSYTKQSKKSSLHRFRADRIADVVKRIDFDGRPKLEQREYIVVWSKCHHEKYVYVKNTILKLRLPLWIAKSVTFRICFNPAMGLTENFMIFLNALRLMAVSIVLRVNMCWQPQSCNRISIVWQNV